MDSNSVKITNQNDDIGTVIIADDVVEMIASLAATEVDGVSSMVGNITNELMSKVGIKKLTKGVRATITNSEVVVDLTVMLMYGYSIPETSKKVQEKVKAAIESMTGLTVKDVNIKIAAIKLDK